MALVAAALLAAAGFTVRIRGYGTSLTPSAIMDALAPLRAYDPVHVDVVSTRRFEDEVAVDTTAYVGNGTFYTASSRAPSLTLALRRSAALLAALDDHADAPSSTH